MSYQSLLKVFEMAPQCRYFTTAGGKSSDEIRKAEDALGVKFSKQCVEFYNKYGYLSFYGNEVFGIDPDDDSGILEGNSVAYALNDREEYNLPKQWIPIYDFQNGNLAYVDYSNLNSENEPRIIAAFYNGVGYEILEVIAEDLGDFILQLIEEQL